MSLRIKLLLFILLTIVNLACVENDNKASGYRIKRYRNGSVKSTGYYINDSIIVDTFRTYYSGGERESVQIFDSNGLLKGTCQYFDELGRLTQTIEYANGKTNGYIIDYFPNGGIESKAWTHNGIMIGDAFEYYPNGKIKLYNFYDFSQHNRLVQEFKIDGTLVRSAGNDFLVDSLLEREDTLQFFFLVAHPPFEKTNLVLKKIYGKTKAVQVDTIFPTVNIVQVILKKTIDLESVHAISTRFDSGTQKGQTVVHIFDSEH